MNEHPDFLRAPGTACKPDRRSEGTSVLADMGIRPKTIDDQHRAVYDLILHGGVPGDVRIQFETTKNLYFYSWFVYRFYPVAQHHAYTCLELALRERFEDEMLSGGKKKRKCGPGLKTLLSYAANSGYLANEKFEVWRHTTMVRATERAMIEALEEMDRRGLSEAKFDETNIEIKDVDRDHDYLSVLLETIPALRNHYAHGSKSLHNQVLGTIQVVAEIINQIFQPNNAGKGLKKRKSSV